VNWVRDVLHKNKNLSTALEHTVSTNDNDRTVSDETSNAVSKGETIFGSFKVEITVYIIVNIGILTEMTGWLSSYSTNCRTALISCLSWMISSSVNFVLGSFLPAV